jgi:hypothetical protein
MKTELGVAVKGYLIMLSFYSVDEFLLFETDLPS